MRALELAAVYSGEDEHHVGKLDLQHDDGGFENMRDTRNEGIDAVQFSYR